MNEKIFVIFLVGSLICLSMASITTIGEDNKEMPYGKPPEKPTITGPKYAECGEKCEYKIRSIDPEKDKISYKIQCSDSPMIITTDYYYSGETMIFNYCWGDFYQTRNPFIIKAKAIDTGGLESKWTRFEVNVTINAKSVEPFFYRFLQNHTILYQLLTNILKKISVC